MSNQVNTDLLEQANFHLDYWSGTLWEKLIQHAIDQKDYEELQRLCKQSWDEIYKIEFTPLVASDVY